MKKLLRRCAALLAVCAIVFSHGLPVLAAESTDEQRYVAEFLTVAAPSVVNNRSTFSGPDIQEDGTVFLERGKTYDFTWEGEQTKIFDHAGIHVAYIMYEDYYFNNFIPLNGEGLFGIAHPEYEWIIHFKDAALYERFVAEEIKMDAAFTNLEGEFEIEIHCYIDRILQLPETMPEEDAAIYANDDEKIDELLETAQELPEPQEVVLKANFEGRTDIGGKRDRSIIRWSFPLGKFESDRILEDNQYTCMIQYDGVAYEIDTGTMNFPGEDSGMKIVANFPVEDYAWTLYEGHDHGYCPICARNAAATTVGATALGLGGSVAANALAGVQPPDFSPDDLPPVQKKRMEDESEELEPETTAGEPPKLPEEDSPNVSMSIYKPFSALVNTKGAAADLSITISGGEGMDWHYIPTAVCLDGLKAVVPTIVNMGSEATLVLALTGAPMKTAYSSIFITVIAWAYTAEGPLVKTSAVTEVALHRKGLEAKWDENGNLKVTSYADSNLDGIVEIKELTEEEYTVTEEDGEVVIRTKESRLGECRIKNKSSICNV